MERAIPEPHTNIGKKNYFNATDSLKSMYRLSSMSSLLPAQLTTKKSKRPGLETHASTG